MNWNELRRKAQHPRADIRHPALDELAKHGDEGRQVIEEALLALSGEHSAKIIRWVRGQRRAVARRLAEETTRRREAALSEVQAPDYFDGNSRAAKRVNDRVNEVREIVDNPYAYLRKELEPLAKLDRRLNSVHTDARRYLGGMPLEFREGTRVLQDRVRSLVIPTSATDHNTTNAEAREALRFNQRLSDELISSAERQAIARINEYRALFGLLPLRIEPRLLRAARNHSDNMKRLGFFDHRSPVAGEETPEKRCARFGVKGYVGENLARGPKTAAAVVDGWRESPVHHRNLLHANAARAGIGERDGLWTLLLAGREKGGREKNRR